MLPFLFMILRDCFFCIFLDQSMEWMVYNPQWEGDSRMFCEEENRITDHAYDGVKEHTTVLLYSIWWVESNRWNDYHLQRRRRLWQKCEHAMRWFNVWYFFTTTTMVMMVVRMMMMMMMMMRMMMRMSDEDDDDDYDDGLCLTIRLPPLTMWQTSQA